MPVGTTSAKLARGGGIDEWHLNHDKPLRHFAFDLGAGFSQVREVPVVSFLSPGLVAIGAIGDAVGGDGVEQDLIQAQAGAASSSPCSAITG